MEANSDRGEGGSNTPYQSNNSPLEDWRRSDPSSSGRAKVDRILAICERNDDIDSLISLATAKDGLVEDKVRQIACRPRMNCPISQELKVN